MSTTYTSLRWVLSFSLLLVFSAVISGKLVQAQTNEPASPKIFAQKLVDDTLTAHPEITGLELAATPPNKSQCVTIASTETKGVGEKCDQDEFTALKTQKPFVEKEKENGKEVYDITIPLHNSEGTIMATAGIDFKPEPDQQETKIVERARQIAKELEGKIGSKEKLFVPVS